MFYFRHSTEKQTIAQASLQVLPPFFSSSPDTGAKLRFPLGVLPLLSQGHSNNCLETEGSIPEAITSAGHIVGTLGD